MKFWNDSDFMVNNSLNLADNRDGKHNLPYQGGKAEIFSFKSKFSPFKAK
jgi:hypothetical protein